MDHEFKEDLDCIEEASDISDNSVKESKVKFYSNVTNGKGKTCTKLTNFLLPTVDVVIKLFVMQLVVKSIIVLV